VIFAAHRSSRPVDAALSAFSDKATGRGPMRSCRSVADAAATRFSEFPMAQPSTLSDFPTPAAEAARPLLSSLARWWTPATPGTASEPVLGYESAQPWTMFGGLVDTRSTAD
jgi:hypothetical protein